MQEPVALVLGASGQIGRFLVPRLLASGWSVHAVSRQPQLSRQPGLKWIQGDLFAGLPDLPPLAAIFSLGPLDGFARWMQSTTVQGSPHIVALGSMSAVSKFQSTDAAERDLAQRLRDAERALELAARTKNSAWTILRCTLIYGAGMDRNLTPITRVAAKCRVFPKLAFASGLRQPVHAADVAEACLAAVANSRAREGILEIGGGECLAFSAMLDRAIDSLPVRVLRVPLGPSLIRLGLGLARVFRPGQIPGSAFLDRLRADLVVDNGPARELLGWTPRGFAPEASTWVAKPLF